MLIQLITQHPEAIGQIVKRTPTWVWGLLAAQLYGAFNGIFAGRALRLLRLSRLTRVPGGSNNDTRHRLSTNTR